MKGTNLPNRLATIEAARSWLLDVAGEIDHEATASLDLAAALHGVARLVAAARADVAAGRGRRASNGARALLEAACMIGAVRAAAGRQDGLVRPLRRIEVALMDASGELEAMGA
jgi:hypothetical protein